MTSWNLLLQIESVNHYSPAASLHIRHWFLSDSEWRWWTAARFSMSDAHVNTKLLSGGSDGSVWVYEGEERRAERDGILQNVPHLHRAFITQRNYESHWVHLLIYMFACQHAACLYTKRHVPTCCKAMFFLFHRQYLDYQKLKPRTGYFGFKSHGLCMHRSARIVVLNCHLWEFMTPNLFLLPF